MVGRESNPKHNARFINWNECRYVPIRVQSSRVWYSVFDRQTKQIVYASNKGSCIWKAATLSGYTGYIYTTHNNFESYWREAIKRSWVPSADQQPATGA